MATTLIHKSQFGEIKVGNFYKPIYCYTLDNTTMTVDLLQFGASIASIKLPDPQGKKTDIVLGFSNLQSYQADFNAYFGGIIGRVCNRIANGTFTVGKKVYNVSINNPPNTLHGGFHGLDKKIWDVETIADKVIFTCISYHLEEGFPGYVEFRATYELTHANELKLDMRAKTTHPTPINLTNHTYFNLAGHETGWAGIKDHDLRINADKYTPVDENMIPTGESLPVKGTQFDIRNRKNLGLVISRSTMGYDCNYCINGEGMRFCARAFHKKSGRVVEVYSDQPGMQFYTGYYLSNIPGKNRTVYNRYSGFCFETQNFPNAINTPSFPNSILEPGDEYCHLITYKFTFDQHKTSVL